MKIMKKTVVMFVVLFALACYQGFVVLAQAGSVPTPAAEKAAYDLLARETKGTLGTLYLDGRPFASSAPYLVFKDKVIIYVNRWAPHTMNFSRDSRVSFFVQTSVQTDNPHAEERIELDATIELVPADDKALVQAVRAEYFKKFPKATTFDQAEGHLFLFYQITSKKIHYIAGFGKVYWLDPVKVFANNPGPSSFTRRVNE